MPMATTNARLAGGHGEVFAHLPIGTATAPESKLAADGVSCTLCHQIGDRTPWHARELHGRLRGQPVTAERAAANVRPLHRGRRPDRAHALGYGRDAHRGDPRPRVGDVRDVPHALHPGIRPAGQSSRPARRAGAVPRVAPQCVPRRAELPGLPHAAGEGADPHRVGARRAARGHGAPYVSRRQLLHAAHAEPLPPGPGRRGAAARAGRVGERHDQVPPAGNGQGRHRWRPRRRRTPHRSRQRDQLDRTQAAHGISIASRLAPLRRQGHEWAHGLRIGCGPAIWCHRRERPRRRCQSVRAALRRDSHPRPGADLRAGDDGPGRRRDDRAAVGHTIRQGQPAPAQGLRQGHRRARVCRLRRRRLGFELHGRGRPGHVLGRRERRAGPVRGAGRPAVPVHQLPVGGQPPPIHGGRNETVRRVLRLDVQRVVGGPCHGGNDAFAEAARAAAEGSERIPCGGPSTMGRT